MDKDGFGSRQHRTCCEKLFVAIRNPSLIRSVRFNSPTTLRDRCVRVSRVNTVAFETPINVSVATTKLNNHCPRISKQSVAPAAADSRKEDKKKVALIRDNKGNLPHVSAPTINLPIHGHENRIPVIPLVGGKNSRIAESINAMSSEYIERVGRKIRSPSDVGVRKPSTARDGFNDKVNDFISRTKNKFHTAPSFTEGSEGKEKRLK